MSTKPLLKDRKLDRNRSFAEHRKAGHCVTYSQDGYYFSAAGDFTGKVPGYDRTKAKIGRMKEEADAKLIGEPKRTIGARLTLDDVAPTVPPEVAKVRKENAAAEAAEKLA